MMDKTTRIKKTITDKQKKDNGTEDYIQGIYKSFLGLTHKIGTPFVFEIILVSGNPKIL